MKLSQWLLALAAYAYEVENDPIMSDATYDILSALSLEAGRQHTGMWVHEMDQDHLAAVLKISRSFYPQHSDVHTPQVELALKQLGIPYVE